MKVTRRLFAKLFAGTPIGMLCASDEQAIMDPIPETGIGLSYWHHRLNPKWNDNSTIWERAFAETWSDYNDPSKRHHDIPVVWHNRANWDDDKERYNSGWPFRGGTYYYPTTDEENRIAASVIQWLGTACGNSFLTEVQRRANDALAQRDSGDKFAQDWRSDPWKVPTVGRDFRSPYGLSTNGER